MLNDFSCSCPVYIACGYTDLRRGIDGLANLVKSQFQMDPFQRALFLFCGAAARNLPLLAAAVAFAPCHITISVKNALEKGASHDL